jgi:putative PIN family toxin of toxin-antitoxin system
MKVKRVILDTNVLISAFLVSGGKPDQVLRYLLNNESDLLFSQDSMDELITRLARPKFRKYRNDAETASYIENLTDLAVWVSLPGMLEVCRDGDDDKFLEMALIGEADCIVTGDQDLLVLHSFENIPILTPAQFLNEIGTS